MTGFWRDIRYGLRMLRKSPGLTAIVAITLGLGIGVNVAIFSIVNGFLLRPLPVRAPDQITVLASEQQGGPLGAYFFSYPDLLDFRKQATDVFSDLFAYQISTEGLSADGKTGEVELSFITGNYFQALGVSPAAGRLILPYDGESQDHAPILVLGYSFWQKRFGGDAAVIGKQVLVDGSLATIVGVVSKQFYGLSPSLEMDCYMPFAPPTGEAHSNGLSVDRGMRRLTVLGRLGTHVTLRQAQSSVNVIANRLALQYPETDKGMTIRVIPERLARPVPQPNNVLPVIATLFLVLGLLVLLLACVNVANIVLARATARQQELRIRAALGATRGRLIRQALTEGALLALLGGVAGVVLGEWTVGAIMSMVPKSNTPVHLDLGLDWRVFSYALIASCLTGIVVGVWPALRASRVDVNPVLQEGIRSAATGAGRLKARSSLVVAQLAGSLMLLIVAGLFVRSLIASERMSLGFNPDNVLNVTLDPHEIAYDQPRTIEFYRELESRARALPGVQSVSLATSVPMLTNSGDNIFVEGHPLTLTQQPPLVLYNRIEPGYFETMGITLLRGRGFVDTDSETAPLVAVINQKMAAEFWPNEDPLGKRFSMKSATGPAWEVVGVSENGKYQMVTESSRPYFYVPLAQNYRSLRTLHIRSSVPPDSLKTSLQREIRDVAPDLPIIQLETMKQSLEQAVTGYFLFRFSASLAGAMGALGLLLTVVGIYGIVSFAAAQRTHEIGIRMALGASPGDILQLVFRHGAKLVIIGVAVGLLAAWVLTRALAHLLIGVSPTDPLTYVVVATLLASVALFACWVPARRATRVDPMVALRYE
jgi:predicted permease